MADPLYQLAQCVADSGLTAVMIEMAKDGISFRTGVTGIYGRPGDLSRLDEVLRAPRPFDVFPLPAPILFVSGIKGYLLQCEPGNADEWEVVSYLIFQPMPQGEVLALVDRICPDA